ncbi:hypothetical protein ACHAXH_001547 [Discostella pseudostelligera]
MASSRRSLLAALWSIVGLLTLTSFIIAIVFAVASINYAAENADAYANGNGYNNNNMQGQNNNNQQQANSGSSSVGSSISVTPRAMVFAAIWTAVLSGILAVYGTVILGVRMPTGKYYACCAGNVHRMTPLSLGAFGGSLLMFANLTLVFAILFGAFEIRHLSFGGGQNEDDDDDDAESNNNIVYQSSFAFSIMCMFFTILYASFSALIFHNSYKLIEESVAEARDELLVNAEGHHISEMNSAPGYIGGDRFGVARSYGKSVGSGGTKPIEVL